MKDLYNGKPGTKYGNAIDAAIASGYYMRSKTGPEEEQWGTMGYPLPNGSGYVFLDPKKGTPEDSSLQAVRSQWDSVDPNTRWNEAFRAPTHGLKNTTEGSLHFSPEDYDDLRRGKMEYMVNSRGEHRFIFPGSGDEHVYVITLPQEP